ncbi:MAG: PH domain-containing protein [Candidatus Aenigmatarchaeota archaeon]
MKGIKNTLGEFSSGVKSLLQNPTGDPSEEFTPLPGEEVLGFYQPHPLAFFHLYLAGVFFCFLSLISFISYNLIAGLFLLLLGLLIIFITPLYQKGHRYWVTNRRIVIARTFLWRDVRDITYDKIVDIVVTQGILGRIYNFGTIIPISASGLGTGMRFITDSKGRLIRSTVEAQTESRYALFGVVDPFRVKSLIERARASISEKLTSQ